MTTHKIIIADSRSMKEIDKEAVDLIITSPPYWQLKNYDVPNQIGYGQTIHEYLKDLYRVWKECFRVLKPGTRLCINIGDQFMRSIVYGRYKIAPLHAEIIAQCERIGFDYMGSIIWQKKTTMNTTGGANVMGSYPYPPNGLIEIDYEFILIFKKPGTRKDITQDKKGLSKLTKEEWKEFFSGHWAFGGEHQVEHQAMFPEELPKRLIKMFSFLDDWVLDPFLGSGTTMKVANELKRNSIGYEVNPAFLEVIKKKVGYYNKTLFDSTTFEIYERKDEIITDTETYTPSIKDAQPIIDPNKFKFNGDKIYKVIEIIGPDTIKLDTGLVVTLQGITLKDSKREIAFEYLTKYVNGKGVTIKFDSVPSTSKDNLKGYIYLKNKIFINKELIKMGLADVSDNYFSKKEYFLKSQMESAKNA